MSHAHDCEVGNRSYALNDGVRKTATHGELYGLTCKVKRCAGLLENGIKCGTEQNSGTRCNWTVTKYRTVVGHKLSNFVTSYCCTLQYSLIAGGVSHSLTTKRYLWVQHSPARLCTVQFILISGSCPLLHLPRTRFSSHCKLTMHMHYYYKIVKRTNSSELESEALVWQGGEHD